MSAAILETNLPFPLTRRGKVRDVYDLGEHFLSSAHVSQECQPVALVEELGPWAKAGPVGEFR